MQFSNLWLGGNNGSLPFIAAGNSAFLQAELYKSIASSTYHALQMNITKRFSHGFAIQGAYTYSHAIDNASDPLVPGLGNQSFPRDSLDLGPEHGNSDFDVRQRLVMNYSWQLPFGRGAKRWSEGFLGKVVEGWGISGITTFSGGLPFDVFTDVDTQHTGFAARPDYNPSATVTPSGNPRTQTGPLVGYFSDPAFGSAGNIGRNVFRGPGINNTDFVTTKRISMTERTRPSGSSSTGSTARNAAIFSSSDRASRYSRVQRAHDPRCSVSARVSVSEVSPGRVSAMTSLD